MSKPFNNLDWFFATSRVQISVTVQNCLVDCNASTLYHVGLQDGLSKKGIVQLLMKIISRQQTLKTCQTNLKELIICNVKPTKKKKKKEDSNIAAIYSALKM